MDFSSLPRYDAGPPRSDNRPGQPEYRSDAWEARWAARVQFWQRVMTYAWVAAAVSLLTALAAAALGWQVLVAFHMVGCFVSGAVGVVAGNYIQSFRCPRCERRFALRWFGHSPLTRSCLHCGYSIDDARRGGAPKSG